MQRETVIPNGGGSGVGVGPTANLTLNPHAGNGMVATPPSNGSSHVDAALLSLQSDVSELKQRLAARDRHVHELEATADATEDVIAEWQAKYDRLFDAHRKLQKTNNALEDKLLRIVDKFESDKNQMTRDLAAQTQKLVQAKLAVQQARDQNRDLQQVSKCFQARENPPLAT